MGFNVFLSYSTDPDEQVIVWRLQTLATAHGINLYVPYRQAGSRSLVLEDEVRLALDSSNCVLAIITSRTGPAVERELNYALAKNKPIIPIVEQTVARAAYLAKFRPVFHFSRDQMPGTVENQVVEFLKQAKFSKEKRQAVGALVAIGLGLFLLSGSPNK
jgi:TIR domain